MTPVKTPGMEKFDYLACDGGPHMLLPVALSGQWKGVTSMLNPLDPKTDYGRACAAVETSQMAVVSVGGGQALVFQDPPLSS